MNMVRQQVINQFPEWAVPIRQLWRADESFRDLGHDYALCLATLARWSHDDGPRGRRAEYLSLRRRLELEIEIKIRSVQRAKRAR